MGFLGPKVSVVDRQVAVVVPVGLELSCGTEDEMGSIRGEGTAHKAGRFCRGLRNRARHALDEFAAGHVNGCAGAAVGETGRTETATAEHKGVETGIGFSEGRREGRSRRRSVGRDPDVLGGPAVLASGRHVRVKAMVGRTPCSRDTSVMNPVKELRWSLRKRIAGKGLLARNQVGLDVVTAGV